jgi:hypothetical protein
MANRVHRLDTKRPTHSVTASRYERDHRHHQGETMKRKTKRALESKAKKGIMKIIKTHLGQGVHVGINFKTDK